MQIHPYLYFSLLSFKQKGVYITQTVLQPVLLPTTASPPDPSLFFTAGSRCRQVTRTPRPPQGRAAPTCQDPGPPRPRRQAASSLGSAPALRLAATGASRLCYPPSYPLPVGRGRLRAVGPVSLCTSRSGQMQADRGTRGGRGLRSGRHRPGGDRDRAGTTAVVERGGGGDGGGRRGRGRGFRGGRGGRGRGAQRGGRWEPGGRGAGARVQVGGGGWCGQDRAKPGLVGFGARARSPQRRTGPRMRAGRRRRLREAGGGWRAHAGRARGASEYELVTSLGCPRDPGPHWLRTQGSRGCKPKRSVGFGWSVSVIDPCWMGMRPGLGLQELTLGQP